MTCQWPLLTAQDDVRDTKQAAFRILLRREQMQHDPELLELIDTPRVTRWTCVRFAKVGLTRRRGPRRHIIVRSGAVDRSI